MKAGVEQGFENYDGVKEVAGNYFILSLKRVKSGGVKT